MEKQKIQPERITKPIQLLGAWLVGLLAINASFLFAAVNIDADSWKSGVLIVAAICNVPIFIGALFLLQTKFRPELQEDSYYSTYLNNRTNELVKVPKKEIQLDDLETRLVSLERELLSNKNHLVESPLSELAFGINVNLTNKESIESALSEHGVDIFREFGHGKGVPNELKVAVAANLPINLKNQIFLMARNLGIEYYSVIEPWEEIYEDVLFGAYGETEGKIRIKKTI